MKTYDKIKVDEWVASSGDYDAHNLLDQKLPGMRRKLDALDKKMRDVLQEIKVVFPDAQYYTASGGFNLLLGSPHCETIAGTPQVQRVAWGGQAFIGDGDF